MGYVKGKVFKLGNSYAIRVNKAIVENGWMIEGEEYELEVRKVSASQDALVKNPSPVQGFLAEDLRHACSTT